MHVFYNKKRFYLTYCYSVIAFLLYFGIIPDFGIKH